MNWVRPRCLVYDKQILTEEIRYMTAIVIKKYNKVKEILISFQKKKEFLNRTKIDEDKGKKV